MSYYILIPIIPPMTNRQFVIVQSTLVNLLTFFSPSSKRGLTDSNLAFFSFKVFVAYSKYSSIVILNFSRTSFSLTRRRSSRISRNVTFSEKKLSKYSCLRSSNSALLLLSFVSFPMRYPSLSLKSCDLL